MMLTMEHWDSFSTGESAVILSLARALYLVRMKNKKNMKKRREKGKRASMALKG